MTCPPCNNQCAQGRTCPARTTRQRAGEPADYTIFTKGIEAVEAERERQAKSDLRSITFVAACVLSFFLIVWGTLP